MTVTVRIEHGAVVLPEELRAELGWEDGTEIVVFTEDGQLRLQRAGLPEPEVYTPERMVEFLLNCAVSEDDYEFALKEARRLGVDVETIPHERPDRWAMQ